MSFTKISTVATLLKTLGINQNEFADAVGLKQSTINQYKTGKRPLTIASAVKICEKFPNVNFSWLMTGEGDMFTKEPEVDYKMEFERLTEENKRLEYELSLKNRLIERFLNEPQPGKKEPD